MERQARLSFGPGVGAGYHSGRNFAQFAAPAYVEDANAYFDGLLSMGYATAGSSIAVFGTQPNDVLSAESIAKVKEHFIEEFGAPLFTIGQGPSGGSMQQQLIANAYPGILDGIMPERLFADEMTFLQPLYDCELLVNVMKQGTWTRDQLTAVAGKYWGYCVSNGARYPRARTDGCDQVVYDQLATRTRPCRQEAGRGPGGGPLHLPGQPGEHLRQGPEDRLCPQPL